MLESIMSVGESGGKNRKRWGYDMSLNTGYALKVAAAVLGCFVLGATSALANGLDPITVAEPMSIAAFVSGLAAIYVAKKRRNRK